METLVSTTFGGRLAQTHDDAHKWHYRDFKYHQMGNYDLVPSLHNVALFPNPELYPEKFF